LSSDLLLAFDFGLRRIGIASGNRLTRTASPLTTLTVHDDVPWDELDRLIAEWQPGVLVVGMPPEHGEGSTTIDVAAFVAALGHRYDIEVQTVDESLTSAAAQSELRESRRSGYLRRRVGKGRIDRHAACLIAEQWLSETAR
jgi:putative holliday junction resolvase